MSPSAPFGPVPRSRIPAAELVAVLLVVGFAFALRVHRLPDASVWWDEGLAVWAARKPLAEMAQWTSADVHPPLYFALLHFWRVVAGDSELAARFPSVAFGSLAVVALWKLGRLLAPGLPWVAVSGASFLALSRFSVWWSQEARMYSLGALLCVLSLLFAVRLARRFDARCAAAYVLTTAAALWTLYLLGFLLAIEGLYWVWTLRDLRSLRARLVGLVRYGTLQLVVVAAFLPWLLYALPRMRTWSVQEAFEPRLFLQLYATLLTLGLSTNVDDVRGPVLLVAAAVAAGVLSLAARWSGPRGGLLLLLLAVAVPPAVVWLVTTAPRSFGYSPKPEARYLLPYAPAFYLLTGWALAAVASHAGRFRRSAALGAFAALALLQAWWLTDYHAERVLVDDYRSAALTLRAHFRPGDVVVLHTDSPWPVFAYHWPGAFTGTPHLQDADPPGVDYFIKPLWEAHDALWLVVNEDSLRVDPHLLFEAWLEQRAVARHSWRFGSTRVGLYVKTEARGAKTSALADGFVVPAASSSLRAGGLEVVGWDQPLRRLRPGESLHLATYVARAGEGGRLTAALGEPAAVTAAAEVPKGVGVARVPISLLVPADAPSGSLPVVLRLIASSSVPPSVASAEEQTVMSHVEVLRSRLPAPRAVSVEPRLRVDSTFGSPAVVRLLGYDVGGSRATGGAVAITLYWQVLSPPPASYKVFVHLIGPDGRVAAQRDDFPVGGQRRTTTWRPGEVLVDRYDVALEPDIAPGTYPLKVGFYDPTTGERLGPVLSANGVRQESDQMPIGTVEVVAR